MAAIEVRQFRRSDRDQLTSLVNSHAQAVVPGIGVSVSALLASLEHRPGEFIIGPWVSDRMTLVAEQDNRVAAAALLLRYFPDERAGPAYRNLGELAWLVFWPQAPAGNPFWTDATGAAEQLIAACIQQFERWKVTQQGAGGELPVHGVYGVPEQWPHVSSLYERAGFTHTGHTEIVYLARLGDLRHRSSPPIDGLVVRRSVGINGTRLSAVLGADVIGYIEVETFDEGERHSRHQGWADIGNLRVAEPYLRRGVGSWLLAQAADWLSLAGVDRLLDYAAADAGRPSGHDDAPYRAFLAAVGFRELTRTRRGWTR